MVNQFKHLKDKPIDNLDTMKIDMYHTRFESIHKSQDEDWNNSNYFESIQSKSERFYDMIQDFFNRFKCDMIQNIMKIFTPS